MQKEIKHTWYFNQSPEEVWQYLTNRDLLEQWMMKNDFEPVVGHKFTFHCHHEVYCEVLEVKPYSKLSYSWRFASVEDDKRMDSKVVWTLTPIADGTELLIVHDGFTLLGDFISHNKGWTALGNNFIQLLTAVTP
ncbi:SRPBCC family protein [Ferruginibacter albus]|uniref:SRPBCC family protein n=1 Tax=Ferruginibacter albus TaxID=2875540 RepID=UPI001CC7F072|nr:SRPBCC domain-containing protein [Ferruginibacter albus]UAY50890.1 SRPBCC domain-containing protein [Ferruginibacter albus]